jgi:transposase
LKNNYPNSFKNSLIRENKNELFYEEAILDSRRYVIVYNPQEAKRQRETRKQIVLKLALRLKENGLKSLIKNKGQKRYLKIAGENSASVDQEKVANEEIFDGIFVCETNNLELSAEKIALEYKNLWQVERAFRNLKDVLEMRPIYHQIDTMITGHIFVSFLALYLEMYLRKKLSENKVEDIDGLIFVPITRD